MLLRHRLVLVMMRARRRTILIAAVVLNIIHPIIHGTPLDSGTLDACLTYIDMMAYWEVQST